VTALLRAVGLTFGYPGREVLRDVSFSLAPGELVALCGPNGAGKSTLLRLLLGLHAPRAGHVELQGAPAASLTRREIARRAALLPQESPVELPHLGRFEAERPEDVQAVTQALEATDTAVLADRPLTELSGGERHRAHFARALAQGAAVLLLDEPIAGHDLSHQLQALQLLRATVDGADGLARGAIVALHDLSLAARFCDRILLLDQGALRADAPPSEVLTVDTLARVFGVRAEVRADAAGRPFVIPISPVAGEESR
jgi:iron complex transport system ATP-binding protein